MQLILDNLVALLVGTVVLVILLALTTGWSTETRDRTRAYTTREMQRSLAEMFERDVFNIGANVPVGDPMLVENSDSVFSFHGAVNGSGAARLIEYRLVSHSVSDSTYKIERWVDGVYTGGSAGLLKSFEVDLLSENDVPVTTAPYSAARKVVIRFQSALPYASEIESERASLRQMNWESVYQPALLAR